MEKIIWFATKFVPMVLSISSFIEMNEFNIYFSCVY